MREFSACLRSFPFGKELGRPGTVVRTWRSIPRLRDDCSGWKFKGSVVSLLPMGYLAFLVLSFVVAIGYAKPKAVCDLDISKGGVKA